MLAGLLFVGCGKKPDVDLWTAVKNGDIAALRKLLTAGPDINTELASGGNTPLMVAALNITLFWGALDQRVLKARMKASVR
ncbi:MAG: ankyrin repeat protein [Kiritimatiellia bacterium]